MTAPDPVLPDRPLSATGIAGLDEVLDGGFAPSRLYLIDGDPGSGKTTLGMQFLLEGVRAGERCLYVTLAETKVELEATARSHGWNLEGLDVLEVIPGDELLSPDHQITLFHPSEVELSETTRAIFSAVERLQPRRVVIDSLSELRLLSQSSLRYRRQILALKRYFIGSDCTVLLLDDRTSESDDRQPFSIAHGVVTLEHLTREYGAPRRRLRVVKYRGSAFRDGYHDFVIRRGGLQVFPRLVASEHGSVHDGTVLASGIRELDLLLGGGIVRGTSMLVIGPAGSGKSTVVLQFALAACERGESAAVFAFEESYATIARRMSGMGRPLGEWIDCKKLRVEAIDPAALSPGEFSARVRREVDAGARVVVIDSLNGYLHAMPGESSLVLHLHELFAFLGHRGVVTFLVLTQQGLIGPTVQTPVDASYLADSAILLRYFEDSGRVRKAISVIKKRTGSHEDTIRELTIDSRGVHIGPPLLGFRGVLTGVPVRETAYEGGVM